MILSTNQELRLILPSNAVDDIANLQGVLDNSEKDFLQDKLGKPLYTRLCEYYTTLGGDGFYQQKTDGSYAKKPWSVLLNLAQRMVVNDAMARYAYQQILSVNGAGVNIASSTDYDPATEILLDKGVAGYRMEAMVSLNNLLKLLENWAVSINTPAETAAPKDGSASTEVPKGESTEVPDDGKSDIPQDENAEAHTAIEEIVLLWQESKYYYLHHDLLFPTCSVLEQYLSVHDNRDKFIRLLPDIRYVQDEYIADVFGDELIDRLQHADDRDKLLRKVRRLMTAYLVERTTVIAFDKATRLLAHNESISLRDSVYRLLNAEKQAQEAADSNASSSTSTTTAAPSSSAADKSGGYENNQEGGKIFVTPLMF
jgi:hypothetical protein